MIKPWGPRTTGHLFSPEPPCGWGVWMLSCSGREQEGGCCSYLGVQRSNSDAHMNSFLYQKCICMCTHPSLPKYAQVSGERKPLPFLESWGVGRGRETSGRNPSSVSGPPDSFREMSVVMQMCRNHQNSCCCSLLLP